MSQAATILIVDDAPENLAVLHELLRHDYTVLAATLGERALRIAAAQPRPDLILLDVMMPMMNGYQVFDNLRANPATRDIPVIFVTALDSLEAELRGLDIGAVDYLTKPVVGQLVLARVRTQLELKQARDRLADQNNWLEREVSRRMAENETIQESAIRALAHLAEIRDPETGNHILRTQSYVQELARLLMHRPQYAAELTERRVALLARSAPLHDIGKVGIPDVILQKPGPLTPQEYNVMKRHSALGAEAIALAQSEGASNIEFLTVAREIARWHHERWDGGGYPDGLAGEAIPLAARIMALADVFDALISPRIYKTAKSYDEARAMIAAGRGKHFDPVITDVFLDHYEAFCAIAGRHRDAATVL